MVNELVEQDAPKDTCLAVLPLGTANDFATSLTIRDDNLVQAMQTAVRGIPLLSGSRGFWLDTLHMSLFVVLHTNKAP